MMNTVNSKLPESSPIAADNPKKSPLATMMMVDYLQINWGYDKDVDHYTPHYSFVQFWEVVTVGVHFFFFLLGTTFFLTNPFFI